MPRIPLFFPLGGLSDLLGFTEQPPRTTVEALNVRGIDPKTGRVRGAQRSGLSRYIAAQTTLGGTAIKRIAGFSRDQSLTIYAKNARTVVDHMWSIALKSGKPCLNMAVDRESSVYCSDGTSIEKISHGGTSIWTLELPFESDNQFCRTVAVDDLGNVYAAVSSGGAQFEARIWKIQQFDEDKAFGSECQTTRLARAEVEWELQPDAFVPVLKIHEGKLYVVLADSKHNRARLGVFTQLNRPTPLLSEEFEIPHPTNGMDIGIDGSIYLAVGRNLFTKRFTSVSYAIDAVTAELETHRIGFSLSPDNTEGVRLWTWFPEATVDIISGTNATTGRKRVQRPGQRIDGITKDGDILFFADAAHSGGLPPFFDWVVDVQFNMRGIDPKNPGFKPRLENFKLEDLAQYEERIWSWYRADDLKDLFEDGQEVLLWRDRSGNGRHWFKPGSAGAEAPILNEDGPGGRASILFSKSGQFLETLPNFGSAFSDRSSQKTAVPQYGDATAPSHGGKFAMFIVARFPATAGKYPEALMSIHQNDGDHKHVLVHYNSGANTDNVSLNAANNIALSSAGCVAWYERSLLGSSLGSGGNPVGTGAFIPRSPHNFGSGGTQSPLQFRPTAPGPGTFPGSSPTVGSNYTSDHNTVIITIVHNGGDVDKGELSVYRVNGRPLDAYDSKPCIGLGRTLLGRAHSHSPPADINNFLGEICEIIVLADYEDGTYPVTVPKTGGEEWPGNKADASPPIWFVGSDTEVEQIEGMLAWRYGIQDIFEQDFTGLQEDRRFPHPYAAHVGPPPLAEVSRYWAYRRGEAFQAKLDPKGHLEWVYDETVFSAPARVNEAGVGSNCAATCDTTKVVTYGINNANFDLAAPIDSRAMLRLRDPIEGGKADYINDWNYITDSTLGAGEESGIPDDQFKQIAVDKFGNAFFPWSTTTIPVVTEPHPTLLMVGHAQTGQVGAESDNEELRLVIRDAGDSATDRGVARKGNCVAIDPHIPDYVRAAATILPQADRRAEFIYVGTNNVREKLFTNVSYDGLTTLDFSGSSEGDLSDFEWYPGATLTAPGILPADPGVITIAAKVNDTTLTIPDVGNVTSGLAVTVTFDTSKVTSVHRLRLVTGTPTQGSQREFIQLAVGNGNIRKFTRAVGSIINLGVPATTGEGRLAVTPIFVDSTTAFGQEFFVDGENDVVYRFNEDTGAEEVVPWLAKKGRLRPRAFFLATWRGRVVRARFAENPHIIEMAKLGDPYDWEFFPPTPGLPDSAVSGTQPDRFGLVPDVITGIIPRTDDELVIGCDSAIFRLLGDPLAGGQILLLSDITGMGFGRAWTKDQDGRIFFVGSKGGIYVLNPGSVPQRLSRDRIEERLRDVDVSSSRFELQWNWRDEGLHVFVVPFGSSPGAKTTHWFWEQKTDSWWEDEFGRRENQSSFPNEPTTSAVLDGDDLADRVMVLGTNEAHILEWDKDATNDDKNDFSDGDVQDFYPIDSFVTFGPYYDADGFRELKWSRLEAVLDDTQDCVNYEIFAGETADLSKAIMVTSGTLNAGRNPSVPARARSSYLWIRFRNSTISERWAFESASVLTYRGGRQRIRR